MTHPRPLAILTSLSFGNRFMVNHFLTEKPNQFQANKLSGPRMVIPLRVNGRDNPLDKARGK
jgi:hypothetical protein